MQADPHHSSRRQWLIIAGIATGLMVAVVGTFTIVLERDLAPGVGIVDLTELSDRQLEHLVSAGLVDSGEPVLMFYSSGMLSIDEAGSLLTSDRIVAYRHAGDVRTVRSLSYDDIADVCIVERGNRFRPTIIRIRAVDGRQLELTISTEENRDQLFVDAIRRRMPAPTGARVAQQTGNAR